MTNTLAIIAAGAMGSAIARRMAENGARVLTSLKGRSHATVDRAHQAGMISANDEEIAAHAELVLSVVPPGEALALAERLQPVFERQSRRPIFMGRNAVNPSTLDRIRAATGQDEHFLDTCIIGSPPKAPRRNYRIARASAAGNFDKGDSGAGKDFIDCRDDRHISDSRTVCGR